MSAPRPKLTHLSAFGGVACRGQVDAGSILAGVAFVTCPDCRAAARAAGLLPAVRPLYSTELWSPGARTLAAWRARCRVAG